MIGALPEWIVDAGKVSGAVAAFIIAIGVIAKSPIGKIVAWLYRRVFGAPISSWFRHQVREAMSQPMLTLRAENETQHAEVGNRLVSVEARLHEVETAVRSRNNP